MKSRTQQEQGSHHIIIVIAVAVVLIGAVGFLFWQNVINKDQSNEATVTSQKTPTPKMQEKSTDKVNDSAQTVTDVAVSTAPQYLIINEWGMKMLLPSPLHGLKYNDYFAYTSNGPENKASGVRLTLNGCALGGIGREDEAVFKQTMNAGGIFDGEVVAKVGNQYYRYAGANGLQGTPACATVDLQNQVRAAVATMQSK